MSDKKPVTDWMTDFDPRDPEYIRDPGPILDGIRAKCPIAHTDRLLGVYLSTTYAAARAITLDTETFSSRRIIVRDTRPDYLVPAPPITLDPPYHAPVKQMLMPPFTLEATKRLEPRIRASCVDLLNSLAGQKSCDAVGDYARHVAARTMTNLLGVPEADSDLLLKWIHEIFVLGVDDNATLLRAVGEAERYFARFVEERRRKSEDDMITLLVNSRTKAGDPLPDATIHATLRVLMMAGIDTTLCVIASALWHLAGHQADREKLVANPEAIPTAIEELLRVYAPVTAGREVMRETEVDGCPVKPGNMMLVSFLAANRDPSIFPDPAKVVLDRKDNRHLAFGFGVHRCIGIHLGRAEVTIAIQEWLKAFPCFSLDPAGTVEWSGGQVRGPKRVPLLLSDRSVQTAQPAVSAELAAS
jgi:cytochrome P450